MSKTEDVRTYGLHQIKIKNSWWNRNGHNAQIWLTTGHSSFFFSFKHVLLRANPPPPPPPL